MRCSEIIQAGPFYLGHILRSVCSLFYGGLAFCPGIHYHHYCHCHHQCSIHHHNQCFLCHLHHCPMQLYPGHCDGKQFWKQQWHHCLIIALQRYYYPWNRESFQDAMVCSDEQRYSPRNIGWYPRRNPPRNSGTFSKKLDWQFDILQKRITSQHCLFPL